MDADIVSRAVPTFCLIVPPHCLRDGFMPSGQLVVHPRKVAEARTVGPQQGGLAP